MYISSDVNMKKYLILAAVISTVITSPLSDVQSAEQQQWGGDGPSPFLLSTVPNDQLIASNSQNVATQTGFELKNVVEPSMPFAMDLQQIAVGGGALPSIKSSSEAENLLTSFDVAPLPDLFSSSSIPSVDPAGLAVEAISRSTAGSDSSNKGTAPAAGSSSSPPPATAPASELPPPAPGSNFDQAHLDNINSLFFDTTGIHG